jgi:hypothetical protein
VKTSNAQGIDVKSFLVDARLFRKSEIFYKIQYPALALIKIKFVLTNDSFDPIELLK